MGETHEEFLQRISLNDYLQYLGKNPRQTILSFVETLLVLFLTPSSKISGSLVKTDLKRQDFDLLKTKLTIERHKQDDSERDDEKIDDVRDAWIKVDTFLMGWDAGLRDRDNK